MKAYALEMRVGADLAARLLVNGALVAEKEPGMMSSHSLAIQHEIVPGMNHIEVIATGYGVPPFLEQRPVEDARPGDCFVDLELDLETVEDRGDVYEVTTEPQVDKYWRPEEEGGPVLLPQRIVLDFHAEGATEPVWLRAEPIAPDSMREAVIAELAKLHEALERRDFGRFEEHMHRRNADMARAFPFSGSAAQRASDNVARLEEALTPAMRVPPLEPAALILTPFAGGRIIDVRARDGRPPLRAVPPSGEPLYLPVSFALVDGGIAVVR